MDDFVFFSDDKEYLKNLLNHIQEYLKNQLKLEFKDKTTQLNSTVHGLNLGVRIWPNMIRVRRENFVRSYQKLKDREHEYRRLCPYLVGKTEGDGPLFKHRFP